MAISPNPAVVEPHLDVPAYRYQRILYPMSARLIALGNPALIPWSLILINLVAHTIGTWALAQWLNRLRLPPAFALTYGLWVGLIASVGIDLAEPLTFALITTGWLAREKERPILAGVLFSLSLFAKETNLLFWAAIWISDLLTKKARRFVIPMGIGGIAFAAWQYWLWSTFGAPGIGSGGAMSTPFEWFPFMGFLKIGKESMKVLAVFSLIFGPFIILPTVWGLLVSAKQALEGNHRKETWSMITNAAAILFLPFSTFREPLGLVRVGTGLLLALIFFTARLGRRRELNYGLASIALLAMLLNG